MREEGCEGDKKNGVSGRLGIHEVAGLLLLHRLTASIAWGHSLHCTG